MENNIQLYDCIGGSSGTIVHSASIANTKCAIKLLPVSFKMLKPESYFSLKNDLYFESSLLQTISHPHIVQMLYPTTKGILKNQCGEPINAHYFVLEILEGKDILSYAKKKVLTEDELRLYFTQVLDAVQYLHSKEIAHCDIKSDNIVLDSTLTKAKLIDFAYAKTLNHQYSGTIRGTRNYMAPEVINRLPYDYKKADVFSLGVTVYSLVTGYFPCKELCIQGDPIYRLICEKRFEDFWNKSKVKGISSELKELIQWMLNPSGYYRPTVDMLKDHSWFKKPMALEKVISKGIKERFISS